MFEDEQPERGPSDRPSKKILRRPPAYSNQGLDRVYGQPIDNANASLEYADSQASFASFASRPGKQRGRPGLGPGPGGDSHRLKDLEAIYLQRLDVKPKAGTGVKAQHRF
jgi:hypothetical protein